jgi:hypothetical protein
LREHDALQQTNWMNCAKLRRGIEELSQRIGDIEVTNALAILIWALECCRDQDMRTADVFAALDFLAGRTMEKWPFDQFRRALECPDSEGRWQNLNASLNGIKLAIVPGKPTRSEVTGKRREWVFEPPSRRTPRRT